MRRILLGVLTIVITGSVAFSQEVSTKKEITVTGVYSTYNMPQEAKQFFDDNLIGVFNSMNRFSVIGYQFRLDERSANALIEKLVAYKQEQILHDQRYVDAELGVVVIPANQLEQMAKAFFVVIPSISGWSTKEKVVTVQKMINGELREVKETHYVASVSISVKIITAEGRLMDTYNKTYEAESSKNPTDAYQQAIRGAISGLELWLRSTDEFKLKTAVRGLLGGGRIVMELGADLGVREGYEFAVEKVIDLGAGFTSREYTAMVRVFRIGDNGSQARVLWGSVNVSDQLIEAPLAGGRFNLYGGVDLMTSTMRTLEFNVSAFHAYKTFNPLPFGIDVGLTYEREIGYATIAKSSLGLIINSPTAFYWDLGVGYELYMGRLSILPEIDLSVLGSYIGLGDATYTGAYGTFDGTLSLIGVQIGGKAKINLNFQFSQKFKFRAWVGFAAYIPAWTSLKFLPDDGSESIDLSDEFTSALYVNNTKVSTFTQFLNYTAPMAGIELVFRF